MRRRRISRRSSRISRSDPDFREICARSHSAKTRQNSAEKLTSSCQKGGAFAPLFTWTLLRHCFAISLPPGRFFAISLPAFLSKRFRTVANGKAQKNAREALLLLTFRAVAGDAPPGARTLHTLIKSHHIMPLFAGSTAVSLPFLCIGTKKKKPLRHKSQRPLHV